MSEVTPVLGVNGVSPVELREAAKVLGRALNDKELKYAAEWCAMEDVYKTLLTKFSGKQHGRKHECRCGGDRKHHHHSEHLCKCHREFLEDIALSLRVLSGREPHPSAKQNAKLDAFEDSQEEIIKVDPNKVLIVEDEETHNQIRIYVDVKEMDK